MTRFAIIAIAVAFCVAGCGESITPEQKAAREAYAQQEATRKAQEEIRRAKQAAYEKYYTDCKAKNGDKHWGPFTAIADYTNPYIWYKNGRFSTIKERIANKSDAVWRVAMKQGACVVAQRDPYGVVLSLDNGASFTIKKKALQKMLKEVHLSLWGD